MLVTIGIPAYNRVESFERALRSAIAQSHQDLEIIVSKDYSDNTAIRFITDKYAQTDKRIQLMDHKASLKTVGNFSFLKDNAQGKYFLWIADDDWIDNNYVADCVDFLEAHPDYSLACGKCFYHDSAGTLIHTDSSFSITQSSFWARAWTYYRHVSLNGYFYGVLRTDLVKPFPLPDQLGFDWCLVGYLCFKGKLKTITTTASHISKGGMSNEGSGLTNYFARSGGIFNQLIGFSSSRNCASHVFRSNMYTISWIKKAGLACIIFVAAYSNTIGWDILLIKRKLVKWLGISKSGVISKKKE